MGREAAQVTPKLPIAPLLKVVIRYGLSFLFSEPISPALCSCIQRKNRLAHHRGQTVFYKMNE